MKALRCLNRPPHSDYVGRVRVSLSNVLGNTILTVDDNGIGMPVTVLTSALLDFGKSFWGRHQRLLVSYLGLQSGGFSATGRYGIGFFSAFMWSNRVKVVSRPYFSALQIDLCVGV